jgi:hypothetical protein
VRSKHGCCKLTRFTHEGFELLIEAPPQEALAMVMQQKLIEQALAEQRAEASKPHLNREHLIESILVINTTITADYLMEFEIEALKDYLDQLHLDQGPRGKDNFTIRPERKWVEVRENMD